MRLVVEERAAAAVRRGHPWVFREALGRGKTPKTGDAVDLVDAKGEALGVGLYDEKSPIAVRVYGRAGRLDGASIASGVERAVAIRDRMYDPGTTTALRLCHGEGDRVPGVVLDRYASVAVLRTDGDAIARWVDDLVPRLARILEPRGIETLLVRLVGGGPEGDKTRLAWGKPAPETIDVLEHKMTMEVDVLRGQKTGAFLDQRENRARVRELSKGRRRVLNLFSYAGGFSVAAALGGAAEVTSVDIAAKAHATAQRTFKKNGIELAKHRFVTADALVYVEELAKRNERFDLVISDPPSFAPNEKAVQRALSSYVKLHRACARLLAPGGIFCASSCSSHVPMERFVGTLDDAALDRSDLRILEMRGAGEDHPTIAAFPEGRYLKFVVLG
ncbi:MAG: class I SAM-dependent rRNA methyltransferase [Polyangiaceae bacterium]|nr:class I SAM-dependent rRNA methyltransferase [Polyangiaceae bacterium]